jgi:hypothetical protein
MVKIPRVPKIAFEIVPDACRSALIFNNTFGNNIL